MSVLSALTMGQLNRRSALMVVLVAGLLSMGAADTDTVESAKSLCQALDPSPVLEPFVDELSEPPEIDISKGTHVILGAYKIKQKLHRDLPETTLYGYGTSQETASSPGPTLVAARGTASYIRWENHIHDQKHLLEVDTSLHWANPQSGGVPIVTHVHGVHVISESDGNPDAWFTSRGDVGRSFTTQNYTYANTQPPATLWYHDHAVGITRLNVVGGLFGFYLLRSPTEEPKNLPSGEFDKLLVLQDKQFLADGSINFPNVGASPMNHPSWCPEYFGDTILVNGKAWPYVDVYPTKYRFRLLNGANARFFLLSLSHPKLRFYQIGTDGGFLHRPRKLKTILMGPAERVDVIIDFSKVKPGHSVLLNNSGDAPYPSGDPTFTPPSAQVVLKFNVVAPPHHTTFEHIDLPKALAPRPKIDVSDVTVRKTMTLTELADADDNPTGSYLNGLSWMDPLTDNDVSMLNTTEIWEIVNLTDDAHPIHIHLVTFLVKSQQPFNADAYSAGNCTLDKQFPDPTSCYTTSAQKPSIYSRGWKDTAVVYPSEVTSFAIRWTTRDGEPFSFDATSGPGYVWHCHILDHEDNDMMRPHKMVSHVKD